MKENETIVDLAANNLPKTTLSTEAAQLSFFEVITSKDIVESIFKNLTWFLACSGLFKLSSPAIKSDNTQVVVAIFILFIILFSLNIVYGARNILIPIDKAFDSKLAKLREENSKPRQRNITNIKRTLCFLATKLGLFYLVLSVLYMWLVSILIDLGAQTIS